MRVSVLSGASTRRSVAPKIRRSAATRKRLFCACAALRAARNGGGRDPRGNSVHLRYRSDTGALINDTFDYVLVATGRKPNVAGLGLNHTSLALDERGVPVYDPPRQAGASGFHRGRRQRHPAAAARSRRRRPRRTPRAFPMSRRSAPRAAAIAFTDRDGRRPARGSRGEHVRCRDAAASCCATKA